MPFILLLSLSFFLVTVSSASAQGAPAGGAGGMMSSFIPMLLLMFIIFYFFMIRPEQKKQKQKQQMLSNLKKGDKIVTIGGIYGTIHGVRDDSFNVRVSDNSVIRVSKTAISTVIADKDSKESSSDEKSEQDSKNKE